MEDKDMMDAPEGSSGFKMWLEDNLRILLSILVVVAIAGGIYSYSKRTQAPAVTEDAAQEQAGTDEETQQPTDEEKMASQDQQQPAGNEGVTPSEPAMTAPTAESRETDTSFVEVAAKGMGETQLARQALANYLEKNPDSSLTKEHKIYIEDYLRKYNSYNGHVYVGTSVEFQKSLIQQAIGKAKTLNEKQLDHLKIYSARVTSLS